MAKDDSQPIALEARTAKAARLSSPSAGRNKAAVSQALAGLLPDAARVLEIASGTGEHALACAAARPDIIWTPSDPDAASRASADAWAVDAGGRIAACLDIDVTRPDWTMALEPVDTIFCANMVHIAPWEAAEGLFAGAASLLKPGGRLHLYGPFLLGDASAPSNLAFDADLKSRDPRWGVRERADIMHLAARAGLKPDGDIEMPANNRLLSFSKAAA